MERIPDSSGNARNLGRPTPGDWRSASSVDSTAEMKRSAISGPAESRYQPALLSKSAQKYSDRSSRSFIARALGAGHAFAAGQRLSR